MLEPGLAKVGYDFKLSCECTTDAAFSKWGIKPVTKSDILQRHCSFDQTGEEFSTQHWYNCYTCGLMWDRGCCNVCALICHDGHDVGYSRLSAFFCDCGAESSSFLNCSPCRCLKSSSNRLIEDSSMKHSSPQQVYVDATRTVSRSVDADVLGLTGYHGQNVLDDFFLIASNINPSILYKNLCNIIKAVIRFQFTSKLSEKCGHLATSLASRLNENRLWSYYDDKPLELGNIYRIRYDHLDMRLRVGVKLFVDTLPVEPLRKPLKASSINLSNAKYSGVRNTSTTRAMGTSSSSRRNLLAADNHARLFIAEAYRVSFYSAISLMNSMPTDSYCDSVIERNIVGSIKVDFMIIGIKIAKDFDRHILVWGISDAVVLVMNEHSTSVEAKIDLTSVHDNMSKLETESIVHCDWLPGSYGVSTYSFELPVSANIPTKISNARRQTVLLLYFTKQVKVFDIRRSLTVINSSENSFSCNHTIRYSMTRDDMVITSGALAPISRRSGFDEGSTHQDGDSSDLNRYIIICLFQNGRVQFVNMTLGLKGELQDQGDIFVEYKEGIRLNQTFGNSYHISFLSQSSLLLYQSSSSSVLALALDHNGRISDSFELLPHVTNGGLDIQGPLFNWTELGIVRRDEMWFYRALCTGKCLSSNHEKLLYVEFNRYKSTVKHVPLTGLATIEGTAVLSLPFYSQEKSKTHETILFCTLRSDGLIFTLDENNLKSSPKTAQESFSHDKNLHYRPVTALTIFESLVCVSNSDACLIHCNATWNKTDGNKKLTFGNREFFYSSTKSGYNFTVGLKGRRMKGGSDTNEFFKEDYAIVAVRILVGSTSLESIPESILLMGRHVQLSKAMKRYHDFILTEQDIIHGIRNGYITISVPSTVDSNLTSIDAIEVYALKRDGMTFLQSELETNWIGWDFYNNIYCSVLRLQPDNKSSALEKAMSSLITISRLLNSHGNRVEIFPKELLLLLVRVTFIDPDSHIAALIKEVDIDETRTIDEGILQGITEFISGYATQLNKSVPSNILDEPNSWRLYYMTNQCARLALQIARDRPLNYIQAIKQLFPGKISTSLARVAKDIYSSSLSRNSEYIRTLMKLGLYEAALTTEENLPSLDIVSSSALDVIFELLRFYGKDTCSILEHFVTERKLNHIDSQTEAAYCCDVCESFPIKIIRYTHKDMSTLQCELSRSIDVYDIYC